MSTYSETLRDVWKSIQELQHMAVDILAEVREAKNVQDSLIALVRKIRANDTAKDKLIAALEAQVAEAGLPDDQAVEEALAAVEREKEEAKALLDAVTKEGEDALLENTELEPDPVIDPLDELEELDDNGNPLPPVERR